MARLVSASLDQEIRMNVQHQPENERFVVVADGVEAEVNYRIDDGVMSITHTGVPEAIGGRGIAGDLVRAAFDHARAQGLKVRPLCSYAEAWSRRHADYADLLA
jgi:predicted GNAT family acetyltransferase